MKRQLLPWSAARIAVLGPWGHSLTRGWVGERGVGAGADQEVVEGGLQAAVHKGEGVPGLGLGRDQGQDQGWDL